MRPAGKGGDVKSGWTVSHRLKEGGCTRGGGAGGAGYKPGAHAQAAHLLQGHLATGAAPPEHTDHGPPRGTWAKRQDEDHRPGSPQQRPSPPLSQPTLLSGAPIHNHSVFRNKAVNFLP